MWKAEVRRLYSSISLKARSSVDSNWENLQTIREIFADRKRWGVGDKNLFCKRAFEIFESSLNDDAGWLHSRMITDIMVFMAKRNAYNESAMDNFSKFILSTSNEMVMRQVMPNFLGLCTSTRYYNPTLLQGCVSYAKDNLNHFDYGQMFSLIWCLGQMRFPCPPIADGIQDILLSENLYQRLYDLSWMLAWYGMIHRHYPKKLLKLILTDSYIEEWRKRERNFNPFVLFQLKIALNLDTPCHELGTGWDNRYTIKRFRACRSGMKNVSDATMRGAYRCLISFACKKNQTQFHCNVWRAIHFVLGGRLCFLSECLSLSGYGYDFEILFDKSGSPLEIPMKWRNRSEEVVVGSVTEPPSKKKASKHRIRVDKVLGVMREGEKIESQGEHLEQLREVKNYISKARLNLASDWGQKFDSLPDGVGHKVVIEANGHRHYARNVNYQLGRTFLKERQTKLLGWKNIPIHFYDWENLKTGDDQAHKIKELLKPYYREQ